MGKRLDLNLSISPLCYCIESKANLCFGRWANTELPRYGRTTPNDSTFVKSILPIMAFISANYISALLNFPYFNMECFFLVDFII